jgi:hypothetical protein
VDLQVAQVKLAQAVRLDSDLPQRGLSHRVFDIDSGASQLLNSLLCVFGPVGGREPMERNAASGVPWCHADVGGI